MRKYYLGKLFTGIEATDLRNLFTFEYNVKYNSENRLNKIYLRLGGK